MKRSLFINSRALAVDDDPTNVKLLSISLSNLGFIVDEASGGQQALQKLSSSHYSLVVTDMQMPCMNGDKLSRAIKGINPEIVTACWTCDPTRFDVSSFDIILSKPFVRRELEQKLIQKMPLKCFFDGNFFDCVENKSELTEVMNLNETLAAFLEGVNKDVQTIQYCIESDVPKNRIKLENLLYKICGSTGVAGFLTLSSFIKSLLLTADLYDPKNKILIQVLNRFVSDLRASYNNN